jgi:2,5-diamino-6-(ribosylamino)-4(3H)-pyrimidinone 5'-phosphate reductase
MAGTPRRPASRRRAPLEPPLERPRVIANCAVSLDGRLAYAGGRRALLSGPNDLRRVQRLRAESGAILVGVGTVLNDDPSLRVHAELLDAPPTGPAPLRVVLDSRGRIPPGARILDRSAPTLVATTAAHRGKYPAHVKVYVTEGPMVDLRALLRYLASRGVRQLLLEGGATVFASFFRAGLVDEFTVYVAPMLIGGATAPSLLGGEDLPEGLGIVRLRRISVEPLDDGVLLSFRPIRT